jgi:hypothetical protein
VSSVVLALRRLALARQQPDHLEGHVVDPHHAAHRVRARPEEVVGHRPAEHDHLGRPLDVGSVKPAADCKVQARIVK